MRNLLFMYLPNLFSVSQRLVRRCVSVCKAMHAVSGSRSNSFCDLDFEDRIYKAYSESLETHSCLPLVKQELQYKIQYQRLSRGEPELTLEHEPPKIYKLTDEEKQKKEIRLKQNRQSALRSRVKSKEKEDKLKKDVDRLSNEQRKLTKAIRELKGEKKLTLAKLQAHLNVCGDAIKRDHLKHELLLH